MIIFPNAKINIGLQVTERRPDGYHNLDTIFYPIPTHDALEVIVVEGADYDCRLHLSGVEIEGDTDNNLVVRAYRLLAADYTLECVKATMEEEDHWYGAKFEPVLSYLITEINK